MEKDQALPVLPHHLTLDGREKLTVDGVTEIERFDEETVVLHTTRGTLSVRGRGLHLSALSLDGGRASVDGMVDSLSYEDEGPAGGLFARIFG